MDANENEVTGLTLSRDPRREDPELLHVRSHESGFYDGKHNKTSAKN